MTTDAQGEPHKPTGPLTFSEAMYHYFAMGNELYNLKVRDTDPEMIQDMQRGLDMLLSEITETADKNGFGKEFHDVIWNERGSEKRTLWIRRKANKLKAAKPSLLSLELLGSAGVVIAVAYYILHLGTSLSLLCGVGIVALRLCLPWVMEKIAICEERGMRKLRGHYDNLYGTKVNK